MTALGDRAQFLQESGFANSPSPPREAGWAAFDNHPVGHLHFGRTVCVTLAYLPPPVRHRSKIRFTWLGLTAAFAGAVVVWGRQIAIIRVTRRTLLYTETAMSETHLLIPAKAASTTTAT
ncbi:hypothetical protein [Paramagnetospirillum marisnigri]|uniref:hypothetical protein n=1 Tax=Paramagnetospirillum marisnigri TaxID=1285242 RepID=UPI0012E8B49B|nr:hypothetical protein [Paramagnetospirillum marisnigri]